MIHELLEVIAAVIIMLWAFRTFDRVKEIEKVVKAIADHLGCEMSGADSPRTDKSDFKPPH